MNDFCFKFYEEPTIRRPQGDLKHVEKVIDRKPNVMATLFNMKGITINIKISTDRSGKAVVLRLKYSTGQIEIFQVSRGPQNKNTISVNYHQKNFQKVAYHF